MKMLFKCRDSDRRWGSLATPALAIAALVLAVITSGAEAAVASNHNENINSKSPVLRELERQSEGWGQESDQMEFREYFENWEFFQVKFLHKILKLKRILT